MNKRFPGPVYIPVPKGWKDGPEHALENLRSKKRHALQRVSDKELVFLLKDTLHPGQAEVFRFVRSSNRDKQFVTAEKTDCGIL